MMLRFGRIPQGLLLAVVVGACGSAVRPPPSAPAGGSDAPPSTVAPSATAPAIASPTPTPSPTLDRTAGWRADVDALLDARDHLHPDGWHGMARADWVAAADAVKARIPTLTDDQALVELVRLAAMPSWSGRDGHSGIFPFIPGSGTHEYPLRWWRFDDGLVITAARAPYEDLAGSTVLEIGDRPIDEVLGLVEPLAPRDSPSNLLAYGPLYLRVSELLAGLGVIGAAGPTGFRLRDRDGHERDVTIEPISADEDAAWNSGLPMRLPPLDADWLRKQATPLWWESVPESRTVFIQQNEVSEVGSRLIDEIRAGATQPDVNRVVLDLRHNGGGNNLTLGPLERILEDPAVDRPGHLYVIVGRITFSAAANFATDLEQSTSATFAGEAMGGSPNQYGDARRVDLPWGNQAVYMATRYWERSTPDDPRVTIEPEIHAGLTSDDYFAGRDPVLQAILDTPVAPG